MITLSITYHTNAPYALLAKCNDKIKMLILTQSIYLWSRLFVFIFCLIL